MTCENVGEGRSDIAGIGILVAFAVQAFISLALAIWIFFLTSLGRLETEGEVGSRERVVAENRLKQTSEILMIGNDIQILTGIGYMVNGFINASTFELYHLRLMFDVVCFVGVSSAVTLVFWSFCLAKLQSPDSRWRGQHRSQTQRPSRLSKRYRATYLFSILFIGWTILLCVRLNQWDDASELPGQCYKTDFITLPDASHPAVDRTYVATTAGWMLCVMVGAVLGWSRRRALLILASLQYPVHLYMMIALRTANQGVLEGGRSEDEWDFGQITALLLLAVTIVEILSKLTEYWRSEKEAKENKESMDALGPSEGPIMGSKLEGVLEAEVSV